MFSPFTPNEASEAPKPSFDLEPTTPPKCVVENPFLSASLDKKKDTDEVSEPRH